MENTVNPVPQIPVIVDKPNPNYLNLFLITVAFVLFSVGVYFLGRQSIQVVQTPPIPVLPQTTVIPTLTVPTDLKSYTDDALGISIQYPSKYIQTNTQNSNYYSVDLLGPDYHTEDNDMGTMRKGTFFILSKNNTCAPSSHVSLDTLIEKNNRYSLYKIKGVEGPDYKIALFNAKDNKCVDVVCSSENLCEGEVFADFNQILSTFKFTESKAEIYKTKTYINSQFGISLNYPTTWTNKSEQNNNREFRFKTGNNEYVSGVIFDGPADNSADKAWSKQLNLKNSKSLLITYTDNLGPGSQGGTKDINAFNQFISTLKFDLL